MITVSEIPESAILVTDSQEIDAVFDSVGQIEGLDRSDYGCLFVIVGEGEYTHIWGCCDIVPYDDSFCDPILTDGKVDKFWTD